MAVAIRVLAFLILSLMGTNLVMCSNAEDAEMQKEFRSYIMKALEESDPSLSVISKSRSEYEPDEKDSLLSKNSRSSEQNKEDNLENDFLRALFNSDGNKNNTNLDSLLEMNQKTPNDQLNHQPQSRFMGFLLKALIWPIGRAIGKVSKLISDRIED